MDLTPREGERRRVDQRLRMRPSHGGAPTDPKLDSRVMHLAPSERILTGHRQVGTGLKRDAQNGGRSVAELDLGPVPDRIDDSDACGGRNIDGLGGDEYPGADRKPE